MFEKGPDHAVRCVRDDDVMTADTVTGDQELGFPDHLDEVWTSIDSFAPDLTDEEWAWPPRCPAGRCRTTSCTSPPSNSMLLGRPLPKADIGLPPHVKNDFGRANERWIESPAGRGAAPTAPPSSTRSPASGLRRCGRSTPRASTATRGPRWDRARCARCCRSASSTAGCTNRTCAAPSAAPVTSTPRSPRSPTG